MFPLLYCPQAGMEGLNEIHTAISSGNIQVIQSYIVTYRKKLKEAVFALSNKDVYVDYGAMGDIAEYAVRQYGDLTEIK